jgi:hypothetical protein
VIGSFFRPLNLVDCRTPEQLLRDGDHRWPHGTLYVPPHLQGQQRERFQQRLLELEKHHPPGEVFR